MTNTSTRPAEATDEGLLRVIGPVGLAASIVNVVIGAGVFALPAVLAAVLGGAAPLAFVAASIVTGFVVISMARAGKRIARSGGPSAYAEAAFGPFAAFITGVLFWLSNLLATAGVSAALADAAGALVPAVATTGGRALFLVLVYAVFVWFNLRGVRQGTGVATVAAALKFTALLIFVAVGATLIDRANLAWPGMPGAGDLGRGAIIAIFALAGSEIALAASGEVRNPERVIPRALVGAMAVIAVLYVVVQVVAQGVLGAALAPSKVPLADALGRAGMFGATFILIASVVSMGGRVAGDLLGSPRQLFAFGRAGVLPRALAAVHPVTHVPHVAVVAHGIIALALALTGSFAALAMISSVALILLYMSCCASAWKLDRQAGKTGFGAALVPVLGIVSLAWMLTGATWREAAATGGVVAVAAGLYVARKKAHVE